MDNTARIKSIFSSESQPLIIQCTSCHTKFAVPRKIVGDANHPRFHCSRCDTVFTLDRSILGLETPVERDQFKFSFGTPEDTVTLSNVHSPTPINSRFEETEEKIELTTPQFEGGVIAQDDYEPISDAQLGPDILNSLSESQSIQSEVPDVQTAMTIPEIEEPMGYESLRSLRNQQPQEALGEIRHANPREPKEQEKRKIISEFFFSALTPKQLLSATFALSLIVIATGTLWVTMSPLSADATLTPLNSGAVFPPPPNAYIQATTIKKLHIDSGETVSVITGMLRNDSPTTLKNVIVEGILYDSQGGVLVRRQVPIAASLGRSRIQSLSIDMIEDLQNSPPAKHSTVRSGTQSEFTIVIPENTQIADARFYASRIYSVEYE